jgi:putative methyltransferase (TIGR04325 family)
MQAKNDFKIWEGIYESFDEAGRDAIGPGFDGDTWRTRTLDAAKACLAALDAGTPIPPQHKQRGVMLPPVAAMMMGTHEKLSVLDIGGGLGIGFMMLLESMPGAAERIDYTVVEVSNICEAGAELFARHGGAIRFATQIPPGKRYDLVHSASALQYVEDWKGLLATLGEFQASHLLLSDVPAGSNPTFASLQNYYGSRIKYWFLNCDELVSVLREIGYGLEMKSQVAARRLNVDDVLPMEHFPASHRVGHSLHLLFRRLVSR